MTYLNSNYLRNVLNKLEENKKNLSLKIAFYNRFIENANKTKEVLKTFDNKTPSKRIDTALKNINKNLYFRKEDEKIFPNKWKLEYYESYQLQDFILSYFKIKDTFDYKKAEEEINRRIEYKQKRIKEIEIFINNAEEKIKKLFTLADEFNEIYEDIPSEAREDLQIKHCYIYL